MRMVEEMVGREVPEELAAPLRRGASEIDLVRSALDDTMRSAFEQISNVVKTHHGVRDYRTAAFVVAIEKIADAYLKMGLG